MNKNDYINEMNKIKATSDLKNKVLQPNNVDSIKTRRFGISQSLVTVAICVFITLVTLGGIVGVISLSSKNNGGNTPAITGSSDTITQTSNGKNTEFLDNQTDSIACQLSYTKNTNDGSYVFKVKNNTDKILSYGKEVKVYEYSKDTDSYVPCPMNDGYGFEEIAIEVEPGEYSTDVSNLNEMFSLKENGNYIFTKIIGGVEIPAVLDADINNWNNNFIPLTGKIENVILNDEQFEFDIIVTNDNPYQYTFLTEFTLQKCVSRETYVELTPANTINKNQIVNIDANDTITIHINLLDYYDIDLQAKEGYKIYVPVISAGAFAGTFEG